MDHLNKLLFPRLKEAPYEIWFQSAQWFQRRRCLKMLTYIHTHTHGRQRPTYKLINEPKGLGELKRKVNATPVTVVCSKTQSKHFKRVSIVSFVSLSVSSSSCSELNLIKWRKTSVRLSFLSKFDVVALFCFKLITCGQQPWNSFPKQKYTAS